MTTINEQITSVAKNPTEKCWTWLICLVILYSTFLTSRFSDMIHSLFTVNSSGDVFLEKHWKSVISRSIVDYFFDAQVV